MVVSVDTEGGSGGTMRSGDSTGPTQVEFELVGESLTFAPYYYPRKVLPSKERNLSEKSAICEGEDVSDLGSKNREISVRGYLRQNELNDYNQFIESGDEYDMISLPWSGEVLLRDTEVEGPIGIDSATGDWLYLYSFELKSTGKDEYGPVDHGIVNEGNPTPDGTGTGTGVI